MARWRGSGCSLTAMVTRSAGSSPTTNPRRVISRPSSRTMASALPSAWLTAGEAGSAWPLLITSSMTR